MSSPLPTANPQTPAGVFIAPFVIINTHPPPIPPPPRAIVNEPHLFLAASAISVSSAFGHPVSLGRQDDDQAWAAWHYFAALTKQRWNDARIHQPGINDIAHQDLRDVLGSIYDAFDVAVANYTADYRDWWSGASNFVPAPMVCTCNLKQWTQRLVPTLLVPYQFVIWRMPGANGRAKLYVRVKFPASILLTFMLDR
jgi:hypothetical protein